MDPLAEGPGTAPEDDPERDRIVREEEKVLDRVRRTVDARQHERRLSGIDYDAELIALRDQIHEARLEDVPPLVEEMERLQQVAARRAEVVADQVDPASPYFGRMVLEEGERKREVLIGRHTFLDSRTGVRIVDWRDAPVSRLYYRYDEGDDYEETFGGRDVEGTMLTRRTLSISGGALRRIGAPQGTFLRGADGRWRRGDAESALLRGGQGAAVRPESHHGPRGRGPSGGTLAREDKHLPEIAALIDARQFDLITRPSSGLVVIQGGAGSGKTTIGLHRLAYLAFQDPRRFRADRMLVVVFNDALARYISRVLPALGVSGVLVITYARWAHKQRVMHVAGLPATYHEETPSVVVRLKKHPAMLKAAGELVARIAARAETTVADALAIGGSPEAAAKVWRATEGRPPGRRVARLARWLADGEGDGKSLDVRARHALERAVDGLRRLTTDVGTAWAELVTDRGLLERVFEREAPGAFSSDEIGQVVEWCTRHATAALTYREEPEEDGEGGDAGEERGADEDGDGAEDDRSVGVDGVSEREVPRLDLEDDTLLLLLHQRLVGGLHRKREELRYEHVFVDEAQDMSPVELAVVLDTCTKERSVTLAGDRAQRLLMDNGFTDWRGVLHELALDHVEVEPLRLSYRSTHEIIRFSTDVLGPLRNEEEGTATRHGAPVEFFRFGDSGEAVGFIAEALRDLMLSEPRASVAVLARYPEQADLYYQGLRTAEVPFLRRIADQDFPFKAGVDVTDVRQVKGLEFDYVVLVECSLASYPEDDEARHLLHIAATRAAHQLWVTTSGHPSLLIPKELRERGY